MRRAKRVSLAIAGSGDRGVGDRVGNHGSGGRAGGRTARRGRRLRRAEAAGQEARRGQARSRGHAARVRPQRGSDGPARALLRGRQPLRVLRDSQRADALPDAGQAGDTAGARPPLRRSQHEGDDDGRPHDPGQGQLPPRHRSVQVADQADALPRRRLHRALAAHRPAPPPGRRRAEVRVPRPPRRPPLRHPPGLRRRDGPGARREGRAPHQDGPRQAQGCAAGLLPAHRRQARGRTQPLRAARLRQGQGAALRVRSRQLPARPRPDHRPGHPVHDLPRRRRPRGRQRHRRRRRRQLVHRAARRSRRTSRRRRAHSGAPARPRTTRTSSSRS